MIFTEANFNRIKDNQVYKENFSNYPTLQEFDKYVEEILEIENINILINNIIRIINIINDKEEDNAQLEIKELILKANLSKNQEVFKNTIESLDSSSYDKFIRINKIINKSLQRNLDEKLELLIELEKLSKFFYPDFSDKLVMQEFKKDEKKNNEPKKINNKNKEIKIEEICEKLTLEEVSEMITCLVKKWGKEKFENFLKLFKGKEIK